ncbi:MAG: hypothetical protein VKL97_01010 [Cyanobacteriota bacterium]|nr:hypothetical protein [Cyanobacteriota bacterium]
MQNLRVALVLLVPLALAAALQAAALPRWPAVVELSEQDLQQRLVGVGLAPTPLAAEPPWRSQRIALSSLRRYSLGAGAQLQLQRMQVQQRGDFQLATGLRAFTPGRSSLARSRGAVVRRSCLMAAGTGVTAEQLAGLAERRDSKPSALFGRLLGLQPNRSWSCLVVSLEAEQPARLEALWPRLLTALTPLAPP